MNNNNYCIHPSEKLCSYFKGFQGQEPEFASLVFLGLDANWSADIHLPQNEAFFKIVINYLKDGVSFWDNDANTNLHYNREKYGDGPIHHPLLHYENRCDHRSGGVPYHRNFSKLGLERSFAHRVSFVELLDVPTTVNTNRESFRRMINTVYIEKLEKIIFHGNNKKMVFVSNSVLTELLAIKKIHGLFCHIQRNPLRRENGLDLLFKSEKVIVYKTYHFSSNRIHNQLPIIRKICNSRV